MNKRKIAISIAVFMAIVCLTAVNSLYAQTRSNGKADDKEKGDKAKFDFYAGAGFAYLDNVYALSDSKVSLYDAKESGDITSGRFKDMSSLSDFVFEPLLGIKYKTDSPFGGKLRFMVWLKYHLYFENDKCSYPEGKIKLEHSVLKNDRLGLEVDFLCGFFQKNYLSGVNETLPANGDIASEERIYSAAVYDEYEGQIYYEHVFIKDKGNRGLTEFGLQPFAGYSSRIYNSKFDNRDQNIIFGGIAVNLEFINKIDLKTSYTYEKVFCPGESELILYDETDTGIDVNANGTSDKKAPLVTKVDRSGYRHVIEIEPSFSLSDRCRLSAGYKTRSTKYTSGNSLDVDHHSTSKDYWQVKAGMKYDFTKDFSSEIEFVKKVENDVDNEKTTENIISASVKYRFL